MKNSIVILFLSSLFACNNPSYEKANIELMQKLSEMKEIINEMEGSKLLAKKINERQKDPIFFALQLPKSKNFYKTFFEDPFEGLTIQELDTRFDSLNKEFWKRSLETDSLLKIMNSQ